MLVNPLPIQDSLGLTKRYWCIYCMRIYSKGHCHFKFEPKQVLLGDF